MRLEIRQPTIVAVIASASLAAGCARHYPEGVYPCAVDGDCPPHWFCHSDALCRSTPEHDASTSVDAAIPDAWTPSDATAPDAAMPDAAIPDAGRDANCATTAYYADCDGDTFAAPNAERVDECVVPSASPSACPDGRWTVTEPTVGNTDCADSNRLAYPRSTTSSATPAWTDSGGRAHFDYNCDGIDTPMITAHDLGLVNCAYHDEPPHTPGTMWCDTDRYAPFPPDNWLGAVPGCGVAGELNRCTTRQGLPQSDCHSAIENVAQPCQ